MGGLKMAAEWPGSTWKVWICVCVCVTLQGFISSDRLKGKLPALPLEFRLSGVVGPQRSNSFTEDHNVHFYPPVPCFHTEKLSSLSSNLNWVHVTVETLVCNQSETSQKPVRNQLETNQKPVRNQSETSQKPLTLSNGHGWISGKSIWVLLLTAAGWWTFLHVFCEIELTDVLLRTTRPHKGAKKEPQRFLHPC